MRRSRRIAWWTAYGVGAAAVVAGLGWTSVRVLRLEQEERAARALADRQETMRAALWRLDFWLAPRLARESARSWLDFEPYHPQTVAFNRLLEPIAEGEVLLPSPLLTFTSPYLPAHFQWRASTGFTSPQMPSDAMRARGVVACEPVPFDPERRASFASQMAAIDPTELERRLREQEIAIQRSIGDATGWIARDEPSERPRIGADGPTAPVPSGSGGVWQEGGVATKSAPRNAKRPFAEPADDYRARQTASNAVQEALEPSAQNQTRQPPQQLGSEAQQTVDAKAMGADATPSVMANSPPVEVGPMLPMWLAEPAAAGAAEGEPRLLLARRVRFERETALQGVLVDWPALQSALLAQIESIAPDARLLPTTDAVGDDARRLASIPAVLDLIPDAAEAPNGFLGQPAAAGLLIVWATALGAIAATGLALRSSIGSAVRTSRFASSVTHELRTPLTTFRLYAEMLAEGLVRDEGRQREYHATLRDEAARLGLLVENVLAWSRVEDGRTPHEPRTLTVGELLASIEPVLARRAGESSASFACVWADESLARLPLSTDPDRVSQILFNFVDNACKYAGGADGSPPSVRLTVERRDGHLVLAVEDSGPGVPERLRARIFRAFDRGERGPGDAVRGLGLGLAISSELARALGGRLRCERSEGRPDAMGGARFSLALPFAVRR